MAILGAQSLTLTDWKKRLAPDGSIDFIVEALMNSNPIMQDIVWKEGRDRCRTPASRSKTAPRST